MNDEKILGFFHPPEILTIEQLLFGAQVLMPLETGTFLVAQKVRRREGEQGEMEI